MTKITQEVCMTVVETGGLVTGTSLHVAWIQGDKRNLFKNYKAKGEYFSWTEGLDIRLLDNMIIHTLVSTGLMANVEDRKRYEYKITTAASGLVVANVVDGHQLVKLSNAEMSSEKPSTYEWQDKNTGLIFAINR